MDFDSNRLINMKPVPNAVSGVEQMESMILAVLEANSQFKYLLIAMESTSFYGVHVANYLSTSDRLKPYAVKVFCLCRICVLYLLELGIKPCCHFVNSSYSAYCEGAFGVLFYFFSENLLEFFPCLSFQDGSLPNGLSLTVPLRKFPLYIAPA